MKTRFALFLILVSQAVAPAFAADAPPAPAAAAPRPYAYKTPKLSRAQLDALLAHPEQLLLIDVRRPDELTAKGGFPAYLSIQAKEIERYLAFIPTDRQIVTVSNHAGRAGAAGDLLASKGFRVVGAVGSENYEEEGGKIVKIVPPPAPAPQANAGAEGR